MKKLLFGLFFFWHVLFLFSETFEIIVNKNTSFVDSLGNDLGTVDKGTVLTVNSEYSEFGSYSSDNSKKSKLYISEKALYLQDIFVNNNSNCLPEGVIGSTYTMNYYLDDIYNKESLKKLFEHEPYLKDFWYEELRNDGEYYWEYFYPFSLIFFNDFYIRDDVFYSPYSSNSLFIKNIEEKDDGFIFYLIPLTYSSNVLPFYENILERNKSNKLKFKFDGDYLHVYKDGQSIFELVKTNDETLDQIRSFYLEQEYDILKVRWPRHADGSCDYDGSSKKATPANTSQSKTSEATKAVSNINVTVNKTMSTNCNLKLRSGEATSTQVLTVMSAGTKVKILELGKAELIDGINSNWVKVEVQSGAKDRDGKTIKAGTVGWCYGGYLE